MHVPVAREPVESASLRVSVRTHEPTKEREDVMRSKRQTTFAKMTRERKVQERRALKLEKKQAAAAARKGISAPPTEAVD
jgi:hypothetical protein